MAQELKRRYDLTTLKVTLLADENPPAVLCELEVTRDHRPAIINSWRVATSELGLPSNLDEACRVTDYWFDLPEQITTELRAVLHESLDPRRPLWLHLTKPYGFLGLVPWEEILVPRLSVPVLRIPDFILEPVRSRQTIDVVLCADDPHASPEGVAETVGWLARQLPHAIPLPTTVHVFTSTPVHERLLAQPQPAGGSPGSILLYDPAGAPAEADLAGMGTPSASTDTTVAERPNPWLSWMQNEMCGRSADVVHFFAHGNLTMGWGSLVLSASPVAGDDPGLVMVPPATLTRFGLTVGAWCSAFSSPRDNLSKIGLRLAADTVAQLRPTSLLHHDLPGDPEGSALRTAYRFLCSPEPSPPPFHPSVFLYCQPHEVSTEPGKDELPPRPPEVELFGPSAKVHELLADRPSSPSWVSASQRYVEQYEWRLRQWNDQDNASPPPELAGGVTKALNLIQDLVDRFAETFSAPPKDLHKSEVVDIGGSPASGPVAGPTEVL